MSQHQEHRKPVQLQLNNSGAWKTIVKFDAADDMVSLHVMEAAKMLRSIDGFIKFRIATAEALPSVLMYLDGPEWRKA